MPNRLFIIPAARPLRHKLLYITHCGGFRLVVVISGYLSGYLSSREVGIGQWSRDIITNNQLRYLLFVYPWQAWDKLMWTNRGWFRRNKLADELKKS